MVKQTSSRRTPPPPPRIIPKHTPSNIPNNIPNQTPTFFGSMVQGMALGAGSSIGHKMVDSIFSQKKEYKMESEEEKEQKNKNICGDSDKYIIDFNKCMDMNDRNYEDCQKILDMYINCIQIKKEGI